MIAAQDFIVNFGFLYAIADTVGHDEIIDAPARVPLPRLKADRIELQTGCGSVVITGSQLTLSDVRKDALIVRGEIRNVQLPCGDVHAAP